MSTVVKSGEELSNTLFHDLSVTFLLYCECTQIHLADVLIIITSHSDDGKCYIMVDMKCLANIN